MFIFLFYGWLLLTIECLGLLYPPKIACGLFLKWTSNEPLDYILKFCEHKIISKLNIEFGYVFLFVQIQYMIILLVFLFFNSFFERERGVKGREGEREC